jgi:hypothetical protein
MMSDGYPPQRMDVVIIVGVLSLAFMIVCNVAFDKGKKDAMNPEIKTMQVTLSVSPEMRDWIKTRAKQIGISDSELIRRAIEAYRQPKGEKT